MPLRNLALRTPRSDTVGLLNRVGDAVWTADGDIVRLYGMPFSTRMTIIRLSSGDVWVHSPIKISGRLIEEIGAIGNVKHLVAPNKLHHLFITEWMKAFPEALSYAAPGLEKKRPDIAFSTQLESQPEPAWASDIAQTIFEGSSAMREVAFFTRDRERSS